MNKDELKDHLFSVIQDRTAGFKVIEIAEMLDIKQPTATRLLQRQHETFSVDKLIQYCQKLGVSVEYKIGGKLIKRCDE